MALLPKDIDFLKSRGENPDDFDVAIGPDGKEALVRLPAPSWKGRAGQVLGPVNEGLGNLAGGLKRIVSSTGAQEMEAAGAGNVLTSALDLSRRGLGAIEESFKGNAHDLSQIPGRQRGITGKVMDIAGAVIPKVIPFAAGPVTGVASSAIGAYDAAAQAAESTGAAGFGPGMVAAGTDAGINLVAPGAGKAISSAFPLMKAFGPVAQRVAGEATAGAGLGGAGALINNAAAKVLYDPNRELTANLGEATLTSALMQGTLGGLQMRGEGAAEVPAPVDARAGVPTYRDLVSNKFPLGSELDAAVEAYNKYHNTAYDTSTFLSRRNIADVVTPEAVQQLLVGPPDAVQKAFGKTPGVGAILEMRHHGLTPEEVVMILRDPKTAKTIRASKAGEAVQPIYEAGLERQAQAGARAGDERGTQALLNVDAEKAELASKAKLQDQSVLPTVPEAPVDINAQFAALVAGKKPAVLLAAGEKIPTNLDVEAFDIKTTPAGTVVMMKGTPAPVDSTGLGMSGAPKPVEGTPAVAVEAKTPSGAVVQGEVVKPADVPQAITAAERVLPAGGEVVATTPQAALEARVERAVDPQATHQIVDDAGNVMMTFKSAEKAAKALIRMPAGFKIEQVKHTPEGGVPVPEVVKPEVKLTSVPVGETIKTIRVPEVEKPVVVSQATPPMPVGEPIQLPKQIQNILAGIASAKDDVARNELMSVLYKVRKQNIEAGEDIPPLSQLLKTIGITAKGQPKVKGIGSSLKDKPPSNEGGFISLPSAATFRGTVQRIRDRGDELSTYAAGKLQRMFELGDAKARARGEQVRTALKGYSAQSKERVNQYLSERKLSEGLPDTKLTPHEMQLVSAIDDIYQTWGLEESVNGPWIRDEKGYRPKDLKPYYVNDQISQDYLIRLREGDESLRPEFTEALKLQGKSPEFIEEHWRHLTQQAKKVTGEPGFNPLREPEGFAYPPSWQAPLEEKMLNYARKSAADLSYFENIQADPAMATLLGNMDNGRGGQHGKVPRIGSTEIGAMEPTELRGLINDAIQEHAQINAPYSNAFTRAAGGFNKLAVQTFQTARDALRAIPAITRTSDLPNMVKGALEGITEYRRLSAEGLVRKGTTFAVDKNRLETGDLITKFNALADAFNKSNGTDALNKFMSAWSARAGELKAAQEYDAKNWDFFKKNGIPDAAELPKEQVVKQFAIHAQQELQGSYNSLDLPPWLIPGTSNGLGQMTSLLRWSWGQMNRQYDSVLKPAAKGELKPLLTLVLGGLATEELVELFNEKILSRKPQDLSTEEWMKVGNPKAVGYALQKLASANVGGVFSQIAALAANQIPPLAAGAKKYAPQNTALSSVANVSTRIGQAVQALEQGQTPEKVLLGMIDGLAKDTVSLYRDVSPRTERPGAREQRLFHAYDEGLGSTPEKANPMTPGAEFKKAETMPEALSSAFNLRKLALDNPKLSLPTVENAVESDPKYYTDWLVKMYGKEKAEAMARADADYDTSGIGGYKAYLLEQVRKSLGKEDKVKTTKAGTLVVKPESR